MELPRVVQVVVGILYIIYPMQARASYSVAMPLGILAGNLMRFESSKKLGMSDLAVG